VRQRHCIENPRALFRGGPITRNTAQIETPNLAFGPRAAQEVLAARTTQADNHLQMDSVSAEPLPDPFPLDDTSEAVPDSSPLRVSSNTQLESGIPPARSHADRSAPSARDHELTLDDGLFRLESALTGVTRTDAQLTMLTRSMRHLAASANAARDANAELMVELDRLRAHLAQSHEEKQALLFRMGQLEQLLNVVRHETSRERAFLVEQQDLFLVAILTDHDRQLSDLQRLLHEALLRKDNSSELAELTAQRDQAREYATHCERERDAAWHELATGKAEVPGSTLGPTSSPVESERSAASAIAAINLRTVQSPVSGFNQSELAATRYSVTGDDVVE
jgi:hypothetical protein